MMESQTAQVVQLKEAEGLGFQEIAVRLHLTVARVRTLWLEHVARVRRGEA